MADSSVNLKAASLTAMLDILVAPAAAAQRIARDPQYLAPLVLCCALPLAANLALIQPRNASGSHETILMAVLSAAMQGIGAAVWIFFCFLLIGKVTRQQRILRVAWSFGVNGSIIASGIPALAQATAVRIAEAAYGSVPLNMVSILPSLGWLEPRGTITAALLAPFDVFLIWQAVLFSQFLVAFGLAGWARWLLGTSIAVIPPVVFLTLTNYILTFAHK